MAQKLDDSELVSFKELLMANSIQVDALAQLLIEEGTRHKIYPNFSYRISFILIPLTFHTKTCY